MLFGVFFFVSSLIHPNFSLFLQCVTDSVVYLRSYLYLSGGCLVHFSLRKSQLCDHSTEQLYSFFCPVRSSTLSVIFSFCFGSCIIPPFHSTIIAKDLWYCSRTNFPLDLACCVFAWRGNTALFHQQNSAFMLEMDLIGKSVAVASCGAGLDQTVLASFSDLSFFF